MIKFKNGIAKTRNRKLTKTQVLEIVELCKSGELPRYLVAALYGVSVSNVTFIMSGYRWSCLTNINGPFRTFSKSRKNTKLMPQDIAEIRFRWQRGTSQNSLAKKFKVSQPVIFDVVHRRTHRHVEG